MNLLILMEMLKVTIQPKKTLNVKIFSICIYLYLNINILNPILFG